MSADFLICNERKKEQTKVNLPFLASFNHHLRLFLSDYFLFVLWGFVKIVTCPGLISVLQLSVFPQTFSVEPVK
jgi:hypothetical protein